MRIINTVMHDITVFTSNKQKYTYIPFLFDIWYIIAQHTINNYEFVVKHCIKQNDKGISIVSTLREMEHIYSQVLFLTNLN